MPTKNAISQAIKIIKPDIKRKEFFKVLKTPDCLTSSLRYWQEKYNIKSWDKRKEKEKQEALRVAKKMLMEY